MNRRVFPLLLFLAAGTVPVDAEMPAQAVGSLVEAERKFARTGQDQGTRAAFLAFLADSAIIFRPGPINGWRNWNERQENGLDLVWEPTFATVSRSANF